MEDERRNAFMSIDKETEDRINQEIDRLEKGIRSGRIKDIEEAQERIESLVEIMNSCLPYRLSDDEL
jgi:low affinity Fe/Cu permease